MRRAHQEEGVSCEVGVGVEPVRERGEGQVMLRGGAGLEQVPNQAQARGRAWWFVPGGAGCGLRGVRTVRPYRRDTITLKDQNH